MIIDDFFHRVLGGLFYFKSSSNFYPLIFKYNFCTDDSKIFMLQALVHMV